MSKKYTVFFSFFICVAGSLLFYLKYSVVDIENRIAVATVELAKEKNNQHILKAEWKALTTPERVQRLAVKYLKMQQALPQQVKEYDPDLFYNPKKKKNKGAKKLSQIISKMLSESESPVEVDSEDED